MQPMILSRSSVVQYLLQQNVIAPDSVVNGDLVVAEATRRNRNFKILLGSDQGYFVKQIQSWDTQSTTGLQKEAICYWMAAKEPSFGCLGEVMPEYVHYNPSRCILITKLHSHSESLMEHHRRTGKFFPAVAGQLGRALAQYHAVSSNKIGEGEYRGVFRKAPPWVLSFDPSTPNALGPASGANVQMLQVLQRYPDFRRQLEALRSQWRTDSLIHGDMKWDNCLVDTRGSAVNEPLRIVDWELADLGDPGWDVGAVFQAYLSFWVFALPFKRGVSSDQIVLRAPGKLESMQPAIAEFWNAYTVGSSCPLQEQTKLLERSMQYAAARMIQTVYEYLHQAPQMTDTALCLMQLSFNMLSRPKEALRELLGF